MHSSIGIAPMRKIIIVSMFIVLASNAPAHASFASIIGKVAQEAGEFVVSKVDDFLNDTLDVLEGAYKRVWNEKPEEIDVSVETPMQRLSSRLEDHSKGDILVEPFPMTNAEVVGGYALIKLGKIAVKAVQQEIFCEGNGRFFKVVTDTNAVIYIRPTHSSKPVGYYQEGDTLCVKKTVLTDALWYETNDGWILASDFKDEVVDEKYLFNALEIYLKGKNKASCEGNDKFLARAIYKRVVVYSDASKFSDPLFFYKRNHIVCVTEMRITNYPETWFKTQDGWVKKMDLEKL